MAKSNKMPASETENAETFEKSAGDFAAPPTDLGDWQDVAAERADGWYKPAEGSWFQGRLLGRYEMSKQRNDDGSVRAFYQVKVTRASARMIVGKKPNDTVEQVPEGAILAFDERASLKVLRPQAESDGVYDVFVQCLGKEIVPNTSPPKSWWNFSTKTKTLRPPRTPLRSRQVPDDDIPF